MKYSTSNIVLATIFFLLIFSLSVEGFKSLSAKYDLEYRVSRLEEENAELSDRLNKMLDLIAESGNQTQSVAIEKTGKKINYEELDLFCMAKNIFHEASIEDELGMYAVAQVTVNRLRTTRYPDSICDVVMQPNQFTWTKDKKRRWSHPSGPAWDKAKEIAKRVVTEGYRVPALQSTTLYHADYVKPHWSKKDTVIAVAQVGTHIFYNELN